MMASPLTTTQALALRCHVQAYKDRIACREHLVASLMQCKQAQGEKVANEQQWPSPSPAREAYQRADGPLQLHPLHYKRKVVVVVARYTTVVAITALASNEPLGQQLQQQPPRSSPLLLLLPIEADDELLLSMSINRRVVARARQICRFVRHGDSGSHRGAWTSSSSRPPCELDSLQLISDGVSEQLGGRSMD
uniref:Uncharacterized protein n=1 Tax=Oryza barthii TaxID=65489 RepID=A0A0D3FD52_9ORYZ